LEELRDDLVTLQVMMALRMYATGCFEKLVAETFGIDQSTASRTIRRVTDALVALMLACVQPTQQ